MERNSEELLQKAIKLLEEIHWSGYPQDRIFSDTSENHSFMVRRNEFLKEAGEIG